MRVLWDGQYKDCGVFASLSRSRVAATKTASSASRRSAQTNTAYTRRRLHREAQSPAQSPASERSLPRVEDFCSKTALLTAHAQNNRSRFSVIEEPRGEFGGRNPARAVDGFCFSRQPPGLTFLPGGGAVCSASFSRGAKKQRLMTSAVMYSYDFFFTPARHF